jgi:hypothetical protein
VERPGPAPAPAQRSEQASGSTWREAADRAWVRDCLGQVIEHLGALEVAARAAHRERVHRIAVAARRSRLRDAVAVL